MIQTLIIHGTLPGLNQLLDAKSYRGPVRGRTSKRWNGYANMKRQWGEAIYWQAVRELKPMHVAHVHYIWIEKDHRRDPDNFTAGGRKIILDSLVRAGILPDDSMKHILSQSDVWEVDPARAGVIVRLEVR